MYKAQGKTYGPIQKLKTHRDLLRENYNSLTVLKDLIANRLAIMVENPGADKFGLGFFLSMLGLVLSIC